MRTGTFVKDSQALYFKMISGGLKDVSTQLRPPDGSSYQIQRHVVGSWQRNGPSGLQLMTAIREILGRAIRRLTHELA